MEREAFGSTSLVDRGDFTDEEAVSAARSMQSKWSCECDGDRQQKIDDVECVGGIFVSDFLCYFLCDFLGGFLAAVSLGVSAGFSVGFSVGFSS